MKRPAEHRTLPVQLSAAELEEKAKLLAQSVDEIKRLEDAKKAYCEANKNEQDDWKLVQRRTAKMVESEHESRNIECRWTASTAQNLWVLHRLDTGEVVTTEVMSATDLQTEMYAS